VIRAGSGFGLEAAMRLAEKGFEDCVSAALKHEPGAEDLIYGLVATLVAAPHSVGGKIHATGHWRVVGFDVLMFLSALKRANRRKDSLPLTGQSCGR
jgi:hypothetical protein